MAKKESVNKNIPQTGRIGRFAKILERETSLSVFQKVLADSEKYSTFKPIDKALWWKEAVESMEGSVGDQKAAKIMNFCGAKCCGTGLRKTAKRLMDEAPSIKDFLKKISTYEVKEGDLSYTLKNKNTIIAEYNRCFCGQVKGYTTPFSNLTYCQCSVEFNKQFFQAAFEKPVKVKLLQSIITGAPTCKFLIKIAPIP